MLRSHIGVIFFLYNEGIKGLIEIVHMLHQVFACTESPAIPRISCASFPTEMSIRRNTTISFPQPKSELPVYLNRGPLMLTKVRKEHGNH